jgi:hypothetical protein
VTREEDEARENYKLFLLKEIQESRVSGEAWNKCTLEKERVKLQKQAAQSAREEIRIETQKLELQMQAELQRAVAQITASEQDKWKNAVREIEQPLQIATQHVYDLQKECDSLRKRYTESESQRFIIEKDLAAARQAEEAFGQKLQEALEQMETKGLEWQDNAAEKDARIKQLVEEVERMKVAVSENQLKHVLYRAGEDGMMNKFQRQTAGTLERQNKSQVGWGKITDDFLPQSQHQRLTLIQTTNHHPGLEEILRSFNS